MERRIYGLEMRSNHVTSVCFSQITRDLCRCTCNKQYTMCKIAHFARKMGGQNFNKFNAVLTSGDYIWPLWSEISVVLPLDFELECILVGKFWIFSTEMADFLKVVLSCPVWTWHLVEIFLNVLRSLKDQVLLGPPAPGFIVMALYGHQSSNF